jgi:2-oxoglutarate ferredoxin oxidoreductase subunit alpha
VNRAGPGLGTIQPGQGDYFQSVKGGGHGDYRLIVLAPSSVQEMADHVFLGFDLADKYRNPVLILSDGAIGQMMEKVEFPSYTRPQVDKSWATVGKPKTRKRNSITSLHMEPEQMEVHNHNLLEKYRQITEHEIRFEEMNTEDAEYLFVAYGLCARICQKAMNIARDKGLKAGILRPVTLYPYPYQRLHQLADQMKLIVSVELNSGQMIEDVRLGVNGKVPVEFYGRMGGMMPTPESIVEHLENLIKYRNVN